MHAAGHRRATSFLYMYACMHRHISLARSGGENKCKDGTVSLKS